MWGFFEESQPYDLTTFRSLHSAAQDMMISSAVPVCARDTVSTGPKSSLDFATLCVITNIILKHKVDIYPENDAVQISLVGD